MSKFRTIEISDPRFEQDGLRQITVKSTHLQGRGDITLFVPPGLSAIRFVPIVILLHGVYGSHWAWAWKGGAHRTAQALIEGGAIAPMVLAMPSDGLWGDGTGYITHSEKDYEKWIVEDVPRAVMEAISCTDADSPLLIAGLSMGGYGALRLGAKYADRFTGISAHSAITRWEEMAGFVEEGIDGLPIAEREKAVIDLMTKNKDRLAALRFDCGREDPLLSGNRLLHRQLIAAGIDHQYEEFPGGHEWLYWELHLEETLRFFNQIVAGRK